MRNTQFIRTLIALTVLVVATSAFATDQTRDAVTFAGRQELMLERPFNDFLGRLPAFPRFDVTSTANYKGYTARWEVKDSHLYLTSFIATAHGRPVAYTLFFPNRNLPILSDWYSGTIHITSGRDSFAQGYHTYERVFTLSLTNGVVTATNEMRNVREDKLKR